MSNNKRTRLIKPTRTQDDLGKWEVLNTTGGKVDKDSVIRIMGTTSSGAYHTFASAIADGSQPSAQLLVLWPDSLEDTLSIASERRLLTMDTSSASVGDLVYLSASVAGEITLSPTAEPVGRVHYVGGATSGLVWIDAKWAQSAYAQAQLDNIRPDWDVDWETTIVSGDGDVHVNNVSGDDDTADGTPSRPYATLDAALLGIPHNRNSPDLQNVEVKIDNTGSNYFLPTHIEALSRVTVEGALPASPSQSGTVSSVQTTTTAEGMFFTTDIPYTVAEQFTGWLIQYQSGKYGWVSGTFNNGGSVQLYATQAVNGASYDTMVATDTFDLYSPSDMVSVQSRNTGSAGTSLDQMDGFKLKFCNIGGLGGNAKLLFYQTRATLQHCYIGSEIKRLFCNNGTLTLTNSYIAVQGETEKFGMVGAAGYGILSVLGGTCFDGRTAGTSNNTPLSARGRGRIALSGPVIVRACRGISLSNGASIDYSNGYDPDVSWYWWEHEAGEPIVEVDYRGEGEAVSGLIPDIHGDTLNAGTFLVNAMAPCRLWIGRGTDILITGKVGGYSTSLTNGSDFTSSQAYDDSFIRMDRDRSGVVQGVNWGPHSQNALAGVNLIIDWTRGPSQVVDASDGANDGGTLTWSFPNGGELGGWGTIEVVQALNLSHSWSAEFLWAGGTPPALSTVSGARDILRFYYTGTHWVGEVVALDVS